MAAGNDTASDTPQPKAGKEFVREFTHYQRRLFLYILSQVGNPVEAEEILQEANLVIWRKCDQFEPGTNFYAWACRISKFEVLKSRERWRRDKLQFSDEFVSAVAAEQEESEEHDEARRAALATCLGKLRKTDRELIQQRYAPGENGLSVAEALDRPINSVYQSLGRIRKALLECINRELATQFG